TLLSLRRRSILSKYGKICRKPLKAVGSLIWSVVFSRPQRRSSECGSAMDRGTYRSWATLRCPGRRIFQMNDPTAPITVALRAPGQWSHPKDLVQRLPAGCRLTAEALFLPDKT